jgi:hypothetical protein
MIADITYTRFRIRLIIFKKENTWPSELFRNLIGYLLSTIFLLEGYCLTHHNIIGGNIAGFTRDIGFTAMCLSLLIADFFLSRLGISFFFLSTTWWNVVTVDNPFLNQFQDIEARLVVSYSVDMYWFDYAGVKVFFLLCIPWVVVSRS